jgi:hypothetical protein
MGDTTRAKRSRLSARRAGSSFEQTIATFLNQRLNMNWIERRVKNGRNDRGDIGGVRTVFGSKVVIETKDYGGEIHAATWLREAEVEAGNDDARIAVVIAKRRGISAPGEQYAILTVEHLARLLLGGVDEADL